MGRGHDSGSGRGAANLQPDAPPIIRTVALCSFSRLVEAETFTHRATAETYVRGVARAPCVVAVSDSAERIQKLFDLPCPQAIRMLDVPHAAQRLSRIAAAIWGEGSAEARTWSETPITALTRDGPADMPAEVAAMAAAHPQQASVAEHAGVPDETACADGRSDVSCAGAANRQRMRRKREPAGGRSTTERRRDALAAEARQPDSDAAQYGVE